MKRNNFTMIIFVLLFIILVGAFTYYYIDTNKKMDELRNSINEKDNKIKELENNKTNKEENNTSNTNENNNLNSQENNSSSNNNDNKQEKVITMSWDVKDCYNCNYKTDAKITKYKYQSAWNKNELTYSLDSSTNTVTISVDYDLIHKKEESITYTGKKTFKINNFTSKVKSVNTYSIGSDIEGEVLLFLLDNGNIEYINVFNALNTQNFKSKGIIKNVSSIDSIYQGMLSYSNEAGYITAYALDTNSKFYDLSKYL